MRRQTATYAAFVLLLLALNLLVFIVPYLASVGNASAPYLYAAFAPTCHQLTSRSLCLFASNADGSYSIGDCLPQGADSYSKASEVIYPDKTGYKFPVCARDTAIYLGMLIGALLLPFLWKIGSEDWPNKWLLVAAAVPIAIDGTTQLVGMRESSNFLRLLTGAIIGIVLPFYILPMLNALISFLAEKFREEQAKQSKQPKKQKPSGKPKPSGKKKKGKAR